MNPNHYKNHDKGYQRYDKEVSDALRTLDNVIHIDIDYIQFCKFCKIPECCIETERQFTVKQSYLTRDIAARLKVPTVLVQHEGDNWKITYWKDSSNNKCYHKSGNKEETLLACMKMIRDSHICPLSPHLDTQDQNPNL